MNVWVNKQTKKEASKQTKNAHENLVFEYSVETYVRLFCFFKKLIII